MPEIIDHVPDFKETREQPGQLQRVAHEAGALATAETAPQFADAVLDEQRDVRAATERFRSSLETSDRPHDKNTAELLTYFPPEAKAAVGGNEFYLSRVFAGQAGRQHAVGYTEINGMVAPRLYYKSKSDGFWRVSPDYEVYRDETGRRRGRYSKGETMEYGYVRETRLHDDLEAKLETMEAGTEQLDNSQVAWVVEHFTRDRLGPTNTYDSEAFEIRIRGLNDFFTYRPGESYMPQAGRKAREVFETMEADEERLPDFSRPPAKVSFRNHSLLGPVRVDTYISKDGQIGWNMAHTSDGRVWVNGLTAPDADKTTSYGTDDEVLSGGVLDTKPLEYESQVDGLEEGIDYVKSPFKGYVEMLILDRLPPIRQFREATGIRRAA